MAKKNTEETKVNTNEEVVSNSVASPTVAPEVAPTVTTEPETVTTTTTVKEAPKAAKAKTSKVDKEFDALVEDTINGVHGSGRERMLALGSNYSKVQTEITRRMRAK